MTTLRGGAGLDITSELTSLRVVVTVGGEIDSATAPSFRRALTAASETGRAVTVDLRAVGSIGAVGLDVLVHAATAAMTQGRWFCVRPPSLHVARMLRIVGVSDRISIVTDAEHPVLTAGEVVG